MSENILNNMFNKKTEIERRKLAKYFKQKSKGWICREEAGGCGKKWEKGEGERKNGELVCPNCKKPLLERDIDLPQTWDQLIEESGLAESHYGEECPYKEICQNEAREEYTFIQQARRRQQEGFEEAMEKGLLGKNPMEAYAGWKQKITARYGFNLLIWHDQETGELTAEADRITPIVTQRAIRKLKSAGTPLRGMKTLGIKTKTDMLPEQPIKLLETAEKMVADGEGTPTMIPVRCHKCEKNFNIFQGDSENCPICGGPLIRRGHNAFEEHTQRTREEEE